MHNNIVGPGSKRSSDLALRAITSKLVSWAQDAELGAQNASRPTIYSVIKTASDKYALDKSLPVRHAQAINALVWSLHSYIGRYVARMGLGGRPAPQLPPPPSPRRCVAAASASHWGATLTCRWTSRAKLWQMPPQRCMAPHCAKSAPAPLSTSLRWSHRHPTHP